MMAKVKGRDTKPELAVRRALFREGFRYRLHRGDLPGRPDIVLGRYRQAIFVHGCFWHGHDCPKGKKRPASNATFWNMKLDGNTERDRRNRSALEAAGWNVVVIWECELETGLSCLLDRLRQGDHAVRRPATTAPVKYPAKKRASRGGTALPIMRATGSSSPSG
jgi:DNA mismatch endonuclease (patch repair protein)